MPIETVRDMTIWGICQHPKRGDETDFTHHTCPDNKSRCFTCEHFNIGRFKTWDADRQLRRRKRIVESAYWCEHRLKCPDIKVNCESCPYHPERESTVCPTCGCVKYSELTFRASEVDYAKGYRYNRQPGLD